MFGLELGQKAKEGVITKWDSERRREEKLRSKQQKEEDEDLRKVRVLEQRIEAKNRSRKQQIVKYVKVSTSNKRKQVNNRFW